MGAPENGLSCTAPAYLSQIHKNAHGQHDKCNRLQTRKQFFQNAYFLEGCLVGERSFTPLPKGGAYQILKRSRNCKFLNNGLRIKLLKLILKNIYTEMQKENVFRSNSANL